MNFEYLNQMIKYIEENLTNDIKKLFHHTGITLQKSYIIV